MNKLRLVKLLVFFLTFVIVFGMILAGQIIYHKITAERINSTLINLNLNQPKGSYLVDYKINDGIMLLHLKGGNIGERLVSVDVKGRAVLATINLN